MSSTEIDSTEGLHEEAGAFPARSGSNRMRILELRSAEGPGGGPEKTILFGASLLKEYEVDVTVVYIRRSNSPLVEISSRASELGVHYVELTHNRMFEKQLMRKLLELVQENDFDVIHSHDYKTAFFARRLSRVCSAKLVNTCHGWTGDTFRERYLYYPADRFLLRKFPCVISVSSEITEVLRKSGVASEKIVTIPNGIDPVHFQRCERMRTEFRAQWGVGVQDVVIGGIGRLEKQKRFDLLIQAFAGVRTQFPQSRLFIAGEGNLRSELESQVEQLNLTDACHLIGHCNGVIPFYSGIDVLVQSSDYEGTPNVILEGMSMNVPIVTTDAGGTCDLVTNELHASVVPCGQSKMLENALSATLCDSEAASRRASVARERVESDLSFVARSMKLKSIYRNLVG